jgi:hypothetical protein
LALPQSTIVSGCSISPIRTYLSGFDNAGTRQKDALFIIDREYFVKLKVLTVGEPFNSNRAGEILNYLQAIDSDSRDRREFQLTEPN